MNAWVVEWVLSQCELHSKRLMKKRRNEEIRKDILRKHL